MENVGRENGVFYRLRFSHMWIFVFQDIAQYSQDFIRLNSFENFISFAVILHYNFAKNPLHFVIIIII